MNAGKVLVLTERTAHLDAIRAALQGKVPGLLVLLGRMSKRQRAAVIAELDALPPATLRILLATGKLVGEGFDHPPLDTLILAMPVSWKGTVQQYAGRPTGSMRDRRGHHRYRGCRPPCPAAHVGQAPARLPGDGILDCRVWPVYAHAHDGQRPGIPPQRCDQRLCAPTRWARTILTRRSTTPPRSTTG